MSSRWLYTLSLHDALPILVVDLTSTVFRTRDWRDWQRAVASKQYQLVDGCAASALHGLEAQGFRLVFRSEEHTSELQSPDHLVCRLLLEKKKIRIPTGVS